MRRASASPRNQCSSRHSSRTRPWKLSWCAVLARLAGIDEVQPHVLLVRPLLQHAAVLSSAYRYSDAPWQKFSKDLDELYEHFQLPIMIGETGYHTTTVVPHGEKQGWFENQIDVIRSKPYIK